MAQVNAMVNLWERANLKAVIHVLKSSVLKHFIWKVAVFESRWMSLRPRTVETAA